MDIQTHIEKALKFLAAEQNNHGQFPAYNFSLLTDAKEKTKVNSTYITSNILHALSHSDSPLIKPMLKRSLFFLQKESHPEIGSLNYHPRKSPEYKTLAIPDDFDASVCAYAAMIENGTSTGEQIFPYMVEREKSEGGPYFTWLANGEKWNDVDLGVNTNILWFCSLNEIYLPETLKYIYDELKAGRLGTQYFTDYTNLYFVSRMIHDGRLEELQEKRAKEETVKIKVSDIKTQLKKLLKKQNALPNVTAQIAVALARAKLDISDISDKDVRIILDLQNKDGSWTGGAFLTSRKGALGDKTYHGSSALTTALAIEFLEMYRQKDKVKETFYFPKYKEPFEQMKKLAVKNERSSFSKRLLRKLAAQKFTVQSALLPHLLLHSLGLSDDRDLATKLGANNIIGWGYYYIEDEVLDEGLDDPAMLELMKVYKEKFFETLRTNSSKETWAEIQKVDKKYNNTLKWELSQARFKGKAIKVIPDYKDLKVLADRSAPFYYAASAMLRDRIQKQKLQTIIHIIRSYLITKQLHDDALDWEEDLKSGRINSVATLIFAKLKGETITLNAKTFDRLRLLFWEKVIDDVVEIILAKIKKAGQLSKKTFKNQDLYDVLFDSLKESAEKTIRDRDAVIKIVKD